MLEPQPDFPYCYPHPHNTYHEANVATRELDAACDAVTFMIEDTEATIKELHKKVKGHRKQLRQLKRWLKDWEDMVNKFDSKMERAADDGDAVNKKDDAEEKKDGN